MDHQNIEEAGIVKVGKQFAHHQIKPKQNKTFLQRVKEKLVGKKKYDSDEVYIANEEAPVNSMGSAGINGLGPSTGGIAGMDPILGATSNRKKKNFKMFRRRALSEARVTTKPRGNGYHDVFVDGEKHPDVEVVNGAGGNASMDKQTYGIRYKNKVQWVGCMKDTRKRLNKMLDDGAM